MSEQNDPSKPQILIDSDWKAQAQAEKERLAEKEAAQAPGAGGAGGQGELPPADFSSLVGMLATQAVMSLGGVADKKTGGLIFDPEMARFYIDLLAVIEEKTKGNLSADEARDIQGALQELRMRFVELARAVAAQGSGRGGQAGVVGSAPGAPKVSLD